MRTLGVIPARYQSSRFEGKPLVPIAGIPMLKRTYLRAKQAESLDDLIVATDDHRIFNFCRAEDIPVQMTSSECRTGTDRVAEVAKKSDYDLYINIQGDEPIIDPSAINDIIKAYAVHGNTYAAYNMYKAIEDAEEETSDTIIKVIFSLNNELLYMSRLPIPYKKASVPVARYKQVCVYGFTAQGLEVFSSRDKTPFERVEDIEILRFLELGYKVRMVETKASSIAVDRPEDIKKVEQWLMDFGPS